MCFTKGSNKVEFNHIECVFLFFFIIHFSSGKFNCTLHYRDFDEHLACNVRRECVGREDEPESCPFTSHLCHHNEALYLQVSHYWSLFVVSRFTRDVNRFSFLIEEPR